MSLFGNLTSDGLEETQDRIGGGFLKDTDAYEATIKVAYGGKSEKGAQNVTLLLDIGGQEYRETIYVTNRKGENHYPNRDDPKKKVPLPGFTTVDDICLVTAEKPLSQMVDEEKIVNVYDQEAKKELPKSVPVLIELTGKKFIAGIFRNLENKTEKNGDEYVAIADTVERNSINKVFHHPTKMTVVEARKGLDATFHDKWVEKNKGNVIDKRTIKDGEAGQSGRPGGKSAPQAGENKPTTKSLFGNKG